MTLVKDVDGLYDAHPEENASANFIREISVSELKKRNLKTLPFDRVLLDLLNTAWLVKKFQLINGHKPDLLSAAIAGEHVGTIVYAD